jgi:biotin carboxylase
MTGAPRAPGLLLVGGAGSTPWSIDIARTALDQARRRSVRVHLTNQEATLVATAAVSGQADAVSVVDFEFPADSAAWAVGRVAAGERLDIVLGIREMAQAAVAETAAALGLPGNPPEAVRRVRAKDACRAALAAAGFLQPQVRLCAGPGDAAAFMTEVPGPWVVKPRDGMGSRGVSRVDSLAGLAAAVAALPTRDSFLIEEFVVGTEFSVEGLFLDHSPAVLAVTAKEKGPPPHFVEVGHVLPAEIPDACRAAIEQQAVAALTALELGYGLFHVELWVTEAGIVLGEVHVRQAGAAIHLMLEHAIPGLELFGLVYDDALGVAAPPPGRPARAAATRFLVAPPGRLTAIAGWRQVLAHPAVLYAELAVAPGDVIRPLTSADDRAGVLVTGAATAAQARGVARRLADSVRFETVPA